MEHVLRLEEDSQHFCLPSHLLSYSRPAPFPVPAAQVGLALLPAQG